MIRISSFRLAFGQLDVLLYSFTLFITLLNAIHVIHICLLPQLLFVNHNVFLFVFIPGDVVQVPQSPRC